jgi:HEPN domain-containing protein
MSPLDPDLESLVRQWIKKAESDFEAAQQLALKTDSHPAFREIVGFHCQQAVEKYIKAMLTYFQIEFPKTHEIEDLLILLGRAEPSASQALRATSWLTPFGAELRYPSDAPEMLPGGETKAVETARAARDVVLRLLNLKL